MVLALLTAPLFFSSPGVVAEGPTLQDDAPVVMLVKGDLWTWSAINGLNQITTWGYNGFPKLSPDGSLVAYSSTATMAVEVIEEQGGIGGGPLPSNIWVIDPLTQDAFRVADQPPDASFMVPNVSSKGVIRSEPTWSPDGSQLAWTELLFPEDSYRLAIYTFATGNTTFTSLNTLTIPLGIPSPLTVKWGPEGLVIRGAININQDPSQQKDAFYFFNNNGVQTAVGVLPSDEFVIEFDWINAGGRWYVLILQETQGWRLIDPANGTTQSLSASPELYSPISPLGVSLSVVFEDFSNYSWWRLDTDGPQQQIATTRSMDAMLISPDGTTAAYIDPNTGGLALWENGVTTPVAGLGQANDNRLVVSAVWGGTRWRSLGTVTAQQAPLACPGFLASRLGVGMTGHVLPGFSPTLREASSSASLAVTVIPEGGQFAVTSTPPQCAENTTWWQVNYNGFIGWLPEGAGQTYYVQPGSPDTLAPNLSGAVLEITEAGSERPALAQPAVNAQVLDTLLWGDRVLWRGGTVNQAGSTYYEVILADNSLAYVLYEAGSMVVRNPGYRSNFSVGTNVRVTQAGDGMRLRSGRSVYSEQLQFLGAGDRLQVVGGPQYSEYFVWWQLRTAEGITGWAVDVPGWLVMQ
jgi:SH3-like domain-containing protein